MRAALALLLGVAVPAAAQRVTFGPQFALADYREVTSGLRYHGTGFAGAARLAWRRWSLEGAVSRVSFDPASGSNATAGFTATEVDAWLGFDVASYASVEVGLMRRTADPEFDAQSVGAVRVGARSFYALGPGAEISFRADYLAAPKFSGGGRAPFSLDLGLGIDVQLSGRLRGLATYQFQRIDRKTNPGGTGEIDAAVQESLARIGLGLGL